jgi:predicted nucleic acid-binding protein
VPDVLVDAGALIALLDRSDRHHDECVATLKLLRAPLATVWPALTEAMHLLGEVPAGRDALCDMVFDGAVKLLAIGSPELVHLKELMRKYRDLPMDFADAALVYAGERDQLTRILTFDRHFTIYRLPRRGRFTVLPTR